MAKAVAEEYKSSLADLNFNSKPHINMLTMLAEENISNASVIVQAIVDHIQKSSIEMKLPGFYLVDSIIKNVGKEYVPLFCQHIVQLFTSAFEKVDETTRSLMFKLRQTWNGPLPNKVLYDLDLQIRKMDPAWPVTAKPSTKGIHINPKFLTGSTDEKKEKVPSSTIAEAVKADIQNLQKRDDVMKQILEQKDQLLKKTAELKKLEMKKLEISEKKRARVLAQHTNNQNFKPNALRDPRMVKINTVAQSTLTIKTGSTSLDSKKIETKSVAGLVPNVAKKSISSPEKPKKTVKAAKSDTAQSNLSVKSSPKKVDQRSGLNKNFPAQADSSKSPFKRDADGIYEKFKADTFSSHSISSKKSSPSKHNFSSDINSRKNDGLPKCDKNDFVQTISGNKPDDKVSSNQNQKSVSSAVGRSTLQQTKYLKENSKFSEMESAQFQKKIPHIKKGHIKNDHSTTNVKKHEQSSALISQNRNQLQSDNSHFSDMKNFVATNVSTVTKTLKRSSETSDTINSDNDPNERQAKKQKLVERQNMSDNNMKEPPVLFGNEDQDQRRSKLQILDPNIQGWAQYKAVHPDEFGSPTSSAENTEGRFRFRRPSVNMDRFPPFDHNRFSRFRFQRGGRFNARYAGRRPQFVRGPRGRVLSSSNIGPLILDPQVVIAQAEEKYHSGRISKGEYLELCHDLQKMLESREYQRYKERMSRIQNIEQSRLDDSSKKFRNNDSFGFPPASNFQKDAMKSQGAITADTTSPTCTKSFTLDGKVRTVQFRGHRAFVTMDNNELKELSFRSEPRKVFIEGIPEPIPMSFDGNEIEFVLNGNKHTMKFGTPAREIYIDNHPYEAQFGGPPFSVLLDGRFLKISLSGPPPQVIVSNETDYTSNESQENYESVPKVTQLFEKGSNSSNTDISAQDIDMRVTPSDIKQPSVLNEVVADAKDVDWRVLPGLEAEMRNQNYNSQLERNDKNNFNMQNPEKKLQSTSDEKNITEEKWYDSPVPVNEWKPMEEENSSSGHLETNNLNVNYATYGDTSWREQEHYQEPSSFVAKQESSTYKGAPEYHQPFERKQDGFSAAPRENWRGMAFSWRPPPFYGRHSRAARMRAPRFGPQVERNVRPRLHDWRFESQNQEPRQSFSFTQDSFKNMPMQPTIPKVLEPSSSLTEIGQSITAPAPVLNVNEIPMESEDRIAETSQDSTKINVEALFAKLMAAGIINASATVSVPVEDPLDVDKAPEAENNDEEEVVQLESVPEIEFKSESLKVPYPNVISALHQGSQCCSCGVRFKDIQSQQYSQHLDWHFRINRREKEECKKPVSKRWYYEIEDWIQFEEFEDCEERAPSFFDLQAENESVESPTPIIPSIAATGDISEECSVCGEQFQLFWVQEEEEWHLKNAIRHDNEAYHPACYEDFKKAQEAQKISDIEEKNKSAVLEKAQEAQKISDVIEEKNKFAVLEDVNETMQYILDEMVRAEVVSLFATSILEEVERLDSLEVLSKAEDILEGKPGVEEIIGLIIESESESESNLNSADAKMVIMQSGGITLKVKAESLQSNPNASSSETDMGSGLENRTDEFRPPTPDPKFQVLPPVSKGSELSGLCCIM